MVNYVYKRNKDGIHYLDLAKTWEKLMVAARVIAATQAKNLKDVLVSNSIKNKNRNTSTCILITLRVQLFGGRVW
jgi:ribosomal protein S2